jgi:ABC-2 type transport system permease protein
MLSDITTIIWKEAKILLQGESRGRLWPLIFLVAFGVFLPLQTGRAWLETPVALAFWLWIPPILVSTWVADSFAGERERHTLETLLASRLSDRAILFGKIGAVVGYAWGILLLAILLGLVTVNMAHWSGGLMLYLPVVGIGGVVGSLLMAILAASAGVLVSLRASTVKQAQQTIGIAVFALAWVPIIALNAVPDEWKSGAMQALVSSDIGIVLMAVGGVLLAVDLALVGAAMARFQRARMILD